MTNPTLEEALACAERGWPVFPCIPGRKIPATDHGHLDATTDPARIRGWFDRRCTPNLAVATGAPGPDVLDIDNHPPAGSGFPALLRLQAAGLIDGAAARVRTPSGGLHYYFAGSAQRNGHLAAAHVDFRAAGGYVLVPPSQVNKTPYVRLETLGGDGGLDWHAAAHLLDPSRDHRRPAPRLAPDEQVSRLAHWVGDLKEGNRNEGLFWAANRIAENDPAADLSPLAAAARQAGLTDPEITSTLNSARRTQARREPPDRQAEGER